MNLMTAPSHRKARAKLAFGGLIKATFAGIVFAVEAAYESTIRGSFPSELSLSCELWSGGECSIVSAAVLVISLIMINLISLTLLISGLLDISDAISGSDDEEARPFK